MKSHDIPIQQRMTCTVREACQASGLGKTKLYELIGNGRLDTMRVGRRRLVKVQSLSGLLSVGADAQSGRASSPPGL